LSNVSGDLVTLLSLMYASVSVHSRMLALLQKRYLVGFAQWIAGHRYLVKESMKFVNQ